MLFMFVIPNKGGTLCFHLCVFFAVCAFKIIEKLQTDSGYFLEGWGDWA